jgi:hypothetical protein
MNATTFAMFTECIRCAGFKRAFSNIKHVNGGRCLRCNGTMRDFTVRPVERMDTIGARLPRAEAVRVIAHALGTIGAACERTERGEKVSLFGFTYHNSTDTWHVLADALSRCDATVRARGYRAAVTKIEGLDWKKGTAEARVRCLDECISRATGIALADVTAWATQGDMSVAA